MASQNTLDPQDWVPKTGSMILASIRDPFMLDQGPDFADSAPEPTIRSNMPDPYTPQTLNPK